ncbi:MAG: PspA-associated protein PspAA [Solirubrobacteraceae bacterium]
MIVRISTENQYRLSEDAAQKLNQIDNETVAAVDGRDEARFRDLFDQMLALVRSEGSVLGDDDLEESDIIMPPPDLTFAEAQAEFTGDGLIPD